MLERSPVVRRLRGLAAEGGQAIVLVVLLARRPARDGGARHRHRLRVLHAPLAAGLGGRRCARRCPGASGRLTAPSSSHSSTRAGTAQKNDRPDIDDVTTTITTKCITSIPGCDPVNAVVVVESAPTKTFFAGVLGINAFSAQGNLDGVLAVRREAARHHDGARPHRLDVPQVGRQQRSGVHRPRERPRGDEDVPRLPGSHDPAGGSGGAAARFRPAATRAPRRSPQHPAANTAYKTNSQYPVVAPLRRLLGQGRSSSSSPPRRRDQLRQGERLHRLRDRAREGAEGARRRTDAPTCRTSSSSSPTARRTSGPSDLPLTSDYRKRPCRQGVNSAATIKAKGTLIYSIGYDLNALGRRRERVPDHGRQRSAGNPESPAITAYSALQQIASPGKCSEPCYPYSRLLRQAVARPAQDDLHGDRRRPAEGLLGADRQRPDVGSRQGSEISTGSFGRSISSRNENSPPTTSAEGIA